jgi:hypothetical protein
MVISVMVQEISSKSNEQYHRIYFSPLAFHRCNVHQDPVVFKLRRTEECVRLKRVDMPSEGLSTELMFRVPDAGAHLLCNVPKLSALFSKFFKLFMGYM